MSENKVKSRNNYNQDFINALSEKYGVSLYFVRLSIRGERTSRTSESIKKEYAELMQPVKKQVEEFSKS